MIRLLLVDDQNLVCQGLKAMLSQETDFEIVGTAENGQDALKQVAALQPDIVLMDVRMPIMDGREATRLISEQFPNTKVLVLSTFDDDQYVADSMRAGAKGYLIKDMPLDELAQTIRLADRGYAQMGPGLMEKLVVNMPKDETDLTNQPPHIDLSQLTPRELEVMRLLRFGDSNREIAEQLYISEGTVKTHITHILNRLDLKNRSQLAIHAHSIFSNE
jgi:DNA-binding NarL/FixJ family response regulator